MNYSRLEIEKKQKELTSTSVKMQYRVKEWMRYCCVFGTVVFVLFFVFTAIGVVRGLVDSAPKIRELTLMPSGEASKMYDADGEVIQTVGAANSVQQNVSIADIPQVVQNAFVAVEDKRFFEHHGVDMRGILLSIYQNVVSDPDMADDNATITLQLIRNQIMTQSNENTLIERVANGIQEQFLAIELEDYLDKKEILEDYLNTISMDENTLGVQAAAKKYFDKDVSEITASEAAVLAAMVDDPISDNPVSGQEANAEKRKIVLKAMLDEGYLTEDEYEDALGDDVYLRIKNITTNITSEGKINSYYADAVINQVISDMRQNLGYTQTQAYNTLYHGGLKIYTCQDKGLQNICDTTINSDSNYPQGTKSYLSYTLVVEKFESYKEYSEIDVKNYFAQKGINFSLYFTDSKQAQKYINTFRKAKLKDGAKAVNEEMQLVKEPQASFVLIEQATGEVKALVGGRGTKRKNRAQNRAMEVTYQPGNVFSILSTYIPALDTAGMTLGSVEKDELYRFSQSGKKVVSSGKYRGQVTLREAITQKLAVPAVKVLEKISPQTGFDYLTNMGFSTLVESKSTQSSKKSTDIQLELAIGKLNQGVTNLELTAAYASLANTGIYQSPRLYNRVVDAAGNVLLDNTTKPTQIMKESTAWLLTNVLQENVKSGSAKEANFETNEIAVAGVTGTNEKKSGVCFEGYTPYYTAGIWSGEDENKKVEVSGYHIRIWKKIMMQVHAYSKHSQGKFKKPANIVKKKICTASGKIAVKGICDKAKSSGVRKEYFVSGTEPQENCDIHVRYAYIKGTNQLADDSTEKKDIEYRIVEQKSKKEED